jgi:hypothetical protein
VYPVGDVPFDGHDPNDKFVLKSSTNNCVHPVMLPDGGA